MVAREICGSSAEDLKLKAASSELIAKHVTVSIFSWRQPALYSQKSLELGDYIRHEECKYILHVFYIYMYVSLHICKTNITLHVNNIRNQYL
jgi:hypothetical protein